MEKIMVKILKNSNDLVSIEDSWNKDIMSSVGYPQYDIRFFSRFIDFYESTGWGVLIITFWVGDQIIGVAPLKSKKVFFKNYIFSLADDLYFDFVFLDKYREQCIVILTDILFNKLNCTIASITFSQNSHNLNVFKKISNRKGFPFKKKEGVDLNKAIIPIQTSWEEYYAFLSPRTRKGFRKLERKINIFDSWQVFCAQVNPDSIKKLLKVEQKSWKEKWRQRNNVKQDWLLQILLESANQDNNVKPLYETEIWFLSVNGCPIAYQLVLLYRGHAIFAKTSYDANFSNLSPGKFLINFVIHEMFKKKTVREIDFLTNLPFVQIWSPLIKYKVKAIVGKIPLLFRISSSNIINKYSKLLKKF